MENNKVESKKDPNNRPTWLDDKIPSGITEFSVKTEDIEWIKDKIIESEKKDVRSEMLSKALSVMHCFSSTTPWEIKEQHQTTVIGRELTDIEEKTYEASLKLLTKELNRGWRGT